MVSCDDPTVEDPEILDGPDCSAIDDKSIELVTGIRFFDENGSSLGRVGNPNVTNDSSINVYPNPNNGVIAISNQNDIEYDLFIFPCTKDTLCSEIDFEDYKFEYSIDALNALDSTTISLTTQNIQLQFQQDFAAGYYKLVFFSEGEDVIIENMYYDSNKTANEIIEFLTGEF